MGVFRISMPQGILMCWYKMWAADVSTVLCDNPDIIYVNFGYDFYILESSDLKVKSLM